MQNTQEKEFHSALKKNFSVFQNALRSAQLDEGLLGDNTVVFTPSSSSSRHYESALRLSKYMNTVKICKRKSAAGCSGLYYDIKYASNRTKDFTLDYSPKIVLADGSIFTIEQNETCSDYVEDCKHDNEGNCIKDDQGNTTDSNWTRNYCATVFIDVNGEKGPNKFGKDLFTYRVYQDKIDFDPWNPYGGKKGNKILTNKI